MADPTRTVTGTLAAAGLRIEPHDAGPLATPGFGADAGAPALRVAPGARNRLLLVGLYDTDASWVLGATVVAELRTRQGDVIPGAEALTLSDIAGAPGSYAAACWAPTLLDARAMYRLLVTASVGAGPAAVALPITRDLVVRPYSGDGPLAHATVSTPAAPTPLGALSAVTSGLALQLPASQAQRVRLATVGGPLTLQLAPGMRVVADIRFAPSAELALTVGNPPVSVTATPVDAQGAAIGGTTVTWSNANPEAATISVAGNTVAVTPVSAGLCVLSATVDGVTRTVQVGVRATTVVPTTVALSLLRLQPGSGTTRIASPVPLAPGMLQPADMGQVRVLVQGAELPVYAEVLTGAVPHTDGSVAWLWLEAEGSLTALTGVAATLTLAAPRTAATLTRQGSATFDNSFAPQVDASSPTRFALAAARVVSPATTTARLDLLAAGTPVSLPAGTATQSGVSNDTPAGATADYQLLYSATTGALSLERNGGDNYGAAGNGWQVLAVWTLTNRSGATFVAGTTPVGTAGLLWAATGQSGLYEAPVATALGTDAAYLTHRSQWFPPSATDAELRAATAANAAAYVGLEDAFLASDRQHWGAIGNRWENSIYGLGAASLWRYCRTAQVGHWFRGLARALQYTDEWVVANGGNINAGSFATPENCWAAYLASGIPRARTALGSLASHWAQKSYNNVRKYGTTVPFARNTWNPLTDYTDGRVLARMVAGAALAHSIAAPIDASRWYLAPDNTQSWQQLYVAMLDSLEAMLADSGRDMANFYREPPHQNESELTYPIDDPSYAPSSGTAPYTPAGPDNTLRHAVWKYAVNSDFTGLLNVAMRHGVELARFTGATAARAREFVRRTMTGLQATTWREADASYDYLDRYVAYVHPDGTTETIGGPGDGAIFNGFNCGNWQFLAETESDATLRAAYADRADRMYRRLQSQTVYLSYLNGKNLSQCTFDSPRVLSALVPA